MDLSDILIYLWGFILIGLELVGIYALILVTKVIKKYIERHGGK